MTGDEQQEPKPPTGTPGGSPDQSQDKFFRGLDNKIYHDKPDIFIRLAQLKRDARSGITASAWPLVIPLAALAGAFLTYGMISITPTYDAYGLLNPPILLLLFLSLAGVACFGIFTGMLAILNSRYEAHYNQTSWYLYNTDFAVLVANEQFGMRILEETKDMPILKWMGAPAPVSFEDCLWFSACYHRAICQYLSSNRQLASFIHGTDKIPLGSLRHGSCLHFLGTQSARTLSWTAMFISCGIGGIFTIPLLITAALRDAERRGSLAAICDFFLGKCDVEASQLLPPPERRPKPEPPAQVSKAENVAGMLRRAAHRLPKKNQVDPKN